MEINNEFHIWKKTFLWFWDNKIIETYDSGKDYILSNFETIINTLHYDFPLWDKRNKLSDFIINIKWYNVDNNKFNLRNVCIDKKCSKSQNIEIQDNDTNKYTFVSWDIKQSSHFIEDTFIVSNDYNISDLILKAWKSLEFTFWFEDYLDFFEETSQYEYSIYYKYEWEWEPSYEDFFINEKININWDDFSISSETISDEVIWEIIQIDVLNEETKKVQISVTEWITLSKQWKINFYLSAKNTITWDIFPITKVNYTPITVIPNDNIGSGSWSIIPTFNLENNSEDRWFNENWIFNVKFNLYDSFWNEHFDNIDWYEISIWSWSSEFIEISESWKEIFQKNISWIKTDDDNSFSFDFRITEPWYHELNWFNIKVKKKLDSDNYISPIQDLEIENVTPSNLYDGDQKVKIFIKEPIVSTLNITCWKTVNINFKCTSDNFSWCNINWNTNQIYTRQDQNRTSGSLSIVDKAFNKRTYNYTMNHVDATAPDITIFKNNDILIPNIYSYKVNDDSLKINLLEWTTSSCKEVINYEVKINWDTEISWSELWVNKIIILPDFFKKSGDFELSITATDKYWNNSSKSISFKLYPEAVSEFNSYITNITPINSKFGNNQDIYEYSLNLEDKYWNKIYDKKILSLKNDCPNNSSCTRLKTKISNWQDAIKEIYSPQKTDNNWSVFFKLISLAPWYFNQLFKIEIASWDENYNDINEIKELFIWTIDHNLFKKPVSWTISIEWSNIPQIWKEQKYNINLSKVDNNLFSNYSNWKINISTQSINNETQWHFWNKFSNIIDSFWNNLNKTLWFTWSIDASENILSWINISTNKLKISYKLWWKDIEYDLNDFSINWCEVSTLWLKVIWNLQWFWKSSQTWQEENFSNIYKSKLRSEIRKNWYNLIKWYQPWILNWINYVEGDIHISWDQDYETLIVKNWNVIIDWDLNLSNKKLWIIILKDSYITLTDYRNKWNIYINKNVENINAIIYADGTFRSADSNWEQYSDNELNKSLELNWSLFTRNTIWWAVEGTTTYILPWWKTTIDFDLAQIYDLNYVRKVDNTCDINNDYSFLIKYNSSILIDPPKWFNIK